MGQGQEGTPQRHQSYPRWEPGPARETLPMVAPDQPGDPGTNISGARWQESCLSSKVPMAIREQSESPSLQAAQGGLDVAAASPHTKLP